MFRPKVSMTCSAFVQPQQPVVHEYASQLIADGAMDQAPPRPTSPRRRTSPENHFIGADFRTNPADCLCMNNRACSSHARIADLMHESLQMMALPCGVWVTSGWNCMP